MLPTVLRFPYLWGVRVAPQPPAASDKHTQTTRHSAPEFEPAPTHVDDHEIIQADADWHVELEGIEKMTVDSKEDEKEISIFFEAASKFVADDPTDDEPAINAIDPEMLALLDWKPD